jgi:hypothetical protein
MDNKDLIDKLNNLEKEKQITLQILQERGVSLIIENNKIVEANIIN